MSRKNQGTRKINGKFYMLCGRFNVFIDSDQEKVDHEVAALRNKWSSVVTRKRHGYDVTLWCF